MANYAAGRLSEAIQGLEDVLANEPGNASARFQLACLQQETGKDYLEAVCNYGEYLRLEPKSGKTDMARQRRALCVRLLAADLASKYGATNVSAAVSEEKIAAATARVEMLKKQVSELERRLNGLTSENERLRRLVGSVGADDDVSDLAGFRPALADDEKDFEAKDDLSDFANLRDEGLAEENEADGFELVKSSGSAEDRKKGAKANAGKSSEKIPRELLHEERPEFYVIQDGDTLYRIALRFYGSTSKWRAIRDANKAVITTDGRLRVGQKIRLP